MLAFANTTNDIFAWTRRKWRMSFMVRPAGQTFQHVQVVSNTAVCSSRCIFFSATSQQTPNTCKNCLWRPVAELESSNEQLPTSSLHPHCSFSHQHNSTHITQNSISSPTAEKHYLLQSAIHPSIHPSIRLSIHPSIYSSVCKSSHRSVSINPSINQ